MNGSEPSEIPEFDIVPEQVDYAADVSDVLHAANGYPPHAGRRVRHREFAAGRVSRFPEGQFAALRRQRGRDRVVGVAITMRTDRSPMVDPLPWHHVVGDHGLPHHEPTGRWLYGVEIAVHPSYQRRGVGSALYRARLALVEELGLEGWYAGGMLMGYYRHAHRLSPRAYAERVIDGTLDDPTVTMQMHRGLHPAGIIEDYYPEKKAGNCAVLLIWRPDAAPARSRAGVRRRQTARADAARRMRETA